MECSVAKRDLYVMKITDIIKNKKNLLVQKAKNIHKKIDLNHYLQTVNDDYQHYYQYMVDEKKQQYQALLFIKQYLEHLSKTENRLDYELTKTKHDQKDILIEINKIKKELDYLIEK
jgi:hypothetical protein